MPDPLTAGIGVGGTLLSSYVGGEASKDAATTSSDASSRTAQLQYEQYLQSRQDLSPYRGVAVGDETYGDGYTSAEEAYYAANPDVLAQGMDARTHYETYGQKEGREWFQPQYSGGALNELADYGPSQVDPSQYIPDTQIPEYQRSVIGDLPAIDQRVSDFNYPGDIPQFNVQGDIPEFDSTKFDIYKDPSYEWRKEEMLRGLDRTAGATGKVTSGNRLEAIMDRTGKMASKEYKDAYGRMLTDYGVRRENEATQYGRDVYGYGEGRTREADIYRRATGEYGLTRGTEDARYGRGVDEYGRVYGRDVDQYGRDLTAYNADVAREGGTYNRGVDQYGIYYGQEGDYLNRLAVLSNIGQTATNTTTGAGGTYAANAGNAITAAGQAQAAGTIGRANAIAGGIGDLTSLYAMSKYGQRPPIQNYYDNYSPYGPVRPPAY